MTAAPHVLLYGTVFRPCGFSLINRRIIGGLRERGYRVTVRLNDGEPGWSEPEERPDVYLFHGDPFDFDKAPGRINAFFLQWEYRRIKREWVDRLNRRFDLVVVPSQRTKEVCEASGVRIRVRVCPGGVDRSEFNPSTTAKPLATERGFRFVFLGGAHERRGLDVLLAAYVEEFSAEDDVALLVKGFHYAHRRPWVERVMKRVGVGRRGAPEVVYLYEAESSVAGYFTAADVGVFPLRAECLGLPVLECIASGRPVIVTGGTGLDEFCNDTNAEFIRSQERASRGKWYLEPDRDHLRQLMRAACERGKLDGAEQRRIADTVARFTWDRSIASLAEAFEQVLAAAT